MRFPEKIDADCVGLFIKELTLAGYVAKRDSFGGGDRKGLMVWGGPPTPANRVAFYEKADDKWVRKDHFPLIPG